MLSPRMATRASVRLYVAPCPLLLPLRVFTLLTMACVALALSQVHDTFMVMFKEEMSSSCGIEVINMAVEDARIVDSELAKALASAAVANSGLEKQNIDAEIVQVKAAAEAKVAMIDAEGKAAAMRVLARAEADRIQTLSSALDKACPTAQHNETIRATGAALNDKSTIVLAQDVGALAGAIGIRKFVP